MKVSFLGMKSDASRLPFQPTLCPLTGNDICDSWSPRSLRKRIMKNIFSDRVVQSRSSPSSL